MELLRRRCLVVVALFEVDRCNRFVGSGWVDVCRSGRWWMAVLDGGLG
jgi:hypothetical protein